MTPKSNFAHFYECNLQLTTVSNNLKLKKLDKQKDILDYKDQKKIQDFINRLWTHLKIIFLFY